MLPFQKKAQCSGCTACYAACPVSCITMVADEEGFDYPSVDSGKCTDCGLCQKVCPARHSTKNTSEPLVFACWYKNDDVRKVSSSGGIFTLLAEQFLQSGGVVFGAAFDENCEVIHTYIEKKEDIDKLRRSKYVQSSLGDTFHGVKRLLSERRKVLFTGTPCQVSGLNNFLGKDYDNLLLVDIVCHGVPSPAVFRSYRREREQQYGAKITECSFRDKPFGWNPALHMMMKMSNGEKYSSLLSEDPYGEGFLRNLFLRPACHHCFANNFRSGSDITLGDYWGINEVHLRFDDKKGTTVAIIKTEKGKKVWSGLQPKIKSRHSSLEKALPGNPCIRHSVAEHPNRAPFFADFASKKETAVIPLIEKYLGRNDVGILNFQYSYYNYGALLVAYSLQRAVAKLGHRAYHVNFVPNSLFESSTNENNPFKRFGERFIRRTGICLNKNDLQRYINRRFQKFITGGDQVFRWHNHFNFLFDWVSGKKTLVSFSASFGVDSLGKIAIHYDKKAYAEKCFRRFDAISVREKSGVKILKKAFGISAEVVLDPTMLLDAEEYQEIIDGEFSEVPAGEFVVYYSLNDELREALYHPALTVPALADTGVFVDMMKNENGQYRSFGQWLNLLKNAQYVITDSFHGTVFAILFRKKFLTLARPFGGDERLVYLFEALGIDKRRFLSVDRLASVDVSLLNEPIDYATVYEKLAAEKQRAMIFLRNGLSIEKTEKLTSLYKPALWERCYSFARRMAIAAMKRCLPQWGIGWLKQLLKR